MRRVFLLPARNLIENNIKTILLSYFIYTPYRVKGKSTFELIQEKKILP